MPSWSDRIRSRFAKTTGRSRGVDAFDGLRSMALDLDPATIQAPDGERWSGAAVAAMEIWQPEAIATIVAVADGTVSLYLSTGGGVIGAGEHAAVRGVAERFREIVAESRGLLQRAEDFPLPENGQVRFHARIADGRFTAVAAEEALRGGRHPLSPLYAAGQDVLTEIRLASPE